MSSTDQHTSPGDDSVAAISVQVLGSSPAMAIASQYLNLAQACGLAALNAVAAQQQRYMQESAALAREITAILPAQAPSHGGSTNQQGMAAAIMELALSLNRG
ncbi:MAG TPA: RebB family R body protein [Skermanella sp.]|jgi:Killing trait|nr:RebB family R body protein [Skermanella sp.]